MRAIATDNEKNEFVIFCIDRENDLNAYIWVSPEGQDRITDIYGLCAYCNHMVEPLYVGNRIPEELIEKAHKKLEGMSKEEKDAILEGFNRKYSQMTEEDYEERKEYEEKALKDIERMSENEDGELYFV